MHLFNLKRIILLSLTYANRRCIISDQALNITYGNASFLETEDELIAAAEEARGPALDLFFEDLSESDEALASFVFGDFNEPSFRDWNKAAFKAGQQPLKVRWPTTLAIEQAGFVDAYRDVYPNVVAKPAFTWTPTTNVTDPEDHHDRIDFVFAKANRFHVTDAAIVGEKSPEADIVVVPWPSDHRAVVAEVEIAF
jgi:exodeoxyribonuclease III